MGACRGSGGGASQLSAEAKAVIARMTSRNHIHMSWARDFVRDKGDIMQDVMAQVPGATDYLIRSVPDADGYADVDAKIDPRAGKAIGGRFESPVYAAMSSLERKKLMNAPVEWRPIRVRVIKNRGEEGR